MLDRVPRSVAAGHNRVALPPEIAFLIGDVAEDALVAAAARAGHNGTAAQDELIASNAISAADYARLLAQHTGLGDASAVVPWQENAATCCPQLPIRAGLVAVRNGNRGVAVAALPQGQLARRLIEKSAGLSVLIPPVVVAPPQTFHDALIARHGHDILRAATEDLENTFPHASARSGSAVWQRIALAALVVGGLAGVVTAPAVALLIFLAVVSVFFLGVSALRLVAVLAAATQPERSVEVQLSDAELPVYTVLVPLYGEANMVGPLLAALDRIDYPRAKLDIKLIVEADDVDTQAALRGRNLRAGYEIVTVPQGQPKTKPRALSFALKLARGTLVTIFDAEDWPQPSQLRRAAAAFSASPPDVACLQARLAWYNWADNWLTRQFAIEYASLFDALLPALDRLGLPLPLGGTSNHFRHDVLTEVGAWDPWNVTEDADLGMRLYRAGYRCRVLDSTTWEEAPNRLPGWLRQRGRWLKGWMHPQLNSC